LAAGDASNAEAQTPTRYEVTERSIRELQQALTSKQVTSRQLVMAYFDRIAAYDHAGSGAQLDQLPQREALEQADALDRERRDGKVRGPMHGMVSGQAEVALATWRATSAAIS
jgi:amidase